MILNFVYPNVNALNRNGRGELDERFYLARQAGCRYVEVPADFVKNKTEQRITGLPNGEFLDKNAIENLYKPTRSENRLKYVLHTEPMRSGQNRLQWYSYQWRKRFIGMLLAICRHLGYAASFIEVHPGSRRNTNEDLVCACRDILAAFKEKYSSRPVILLENRTNQFISTGEGLRSFWSHLINSHAELEPQVGIVLDVQQLFTSSGCQTERFKKELELIPGAAIKGLHIHCRHGPPSLTDPIPWKFVFDHLQDIIPQAILNPEVHHKQDVPITIRFCLDRAQESPQDQRDPKPGGNCQEQDTDRQRGIIMNPHNITMDHIKQAAQQIDAKGVPPDRISKKYDAVVNVRRYPPVYLYELAFRIANGSLRKFKAQEAIMNLQRLGIEIVER